MWHINQDVVTVENHPDGIFKHNQLFVVKALRSCPCKCGSVQIDVGLKSPTKLKQCSVSNREYKDKITNLFSNEIFFKPLDEIADISELVDIIHNTEVEA